MTNLKWAKYADHYGECVVLNQNAELVPTKCNIPHSTVCLMKKYPTRKTDLVGILEENLKANASKERYGITGNVDCQMQQFCCICIMY